MHDLDLNFVGNIGSYGKEKGTLDTPYDVKCDANGIMYIVELDNKRVLALLIHFGDERVGNIGLPTALDIVNDKVYVCDFADDHIVVHTTSGSFVGVIGSHGQGVGNMILENENSLN